MWKESGSGHTTMTGNVNFGVDIADEGRRKLIPGQQPAGISPPGLHYLPGLQAMKAASSTPPPL